MAFVPPFFGKFGRNVQDLLKKKYEGDNSVKFVRKGAGGGALTLEQGATLGDQPKGFLKAKLTDKRRGEFEAEVSSDAAAASRASAKFTQLGVRGLAATLELMSKEKDKTFNGPVAKVDVEFAQEYAATQLTVRSDSVVHKLNATGAVGFDGFSVGGAVLLDCSGGVEVADANVGAEYAAKDAVLSLWTEKNMEFVNAGVFYQYNKGLQLGGVAKLGLAKMESEVTLGSDYMLNARTQLKAKLALPSAELSVAMEQRLANPQLAVAFTSGYNVKALLNGTVRANKFGFAATFGDY